MIKQVAIQTESGIERREKGALLLGESRVFIIREGPPQGSDRCVPQLASSTSGKTPAHPTSLRCHPQRYYYSQVHHSYPSAAVLATPA